MDRRAFLNMLAGTMVVATSVPAFASDPVQAAIARLQAEGFRKIAAERTFLGRVRITAERRGQSREVVLDPRSGEVLRDLTRVSDSDGSGSGSSGSGSSGNSGSGSGNSGSGSDDSGSDDGGSDDSGSDDSGSDSDSDSDSDSGHDSDSDSDSDDDSDSGGSSGSGSGHD